MTDHTPAQGHAPGLPTSSIDACYRKSLRLSGILSAIAHLENEDACAEGRSALIFLAEELSGDLERALDTISTSKGRVAA